MKDFRLVALMEFSKCEILMLGKFVSFFVSSTEELIYFCSITVAPWIANGRKTNSHSGNILRKIIIFCFKKIVY
jgi:hypothetical protein